MMKRFLVALMLLASPVLAQQGEPANDPLKARAQQLAQVAGPMVGMQPVLPDNVPTVSLNGMVELIVEADEPFIVRGYIEIDFDMDSGDVSASLFGVVPVSGDIGGLANSEDPLDMTGYPVQSEMVGGVDIFFEGEGRFGEVSNITRMEMRGQGSFYGESPLIMTGPLAGEMRVGRRQHDFKGAFVAVQFEQP